MIGSCMVLILLFAEQVMLGQKTAGGSRSGLEKSLSSLSPGVASKENRRVAAPPCNGGRWDADVRCEEGVAMLLSL